MNTFWFSIVNRGWVTLIAVIATMLCVDLLLLSLLWLALLIVIVRQPQNRQKYWRYLTTVVLPLFLSLTLIWEIASDTVPNPDFNAYQHGGILYAALISLRIAVIGAIVHLCFRPLLDENLLIHAVKSWRIRGKYLIICIATLSLVENLRSQVQLVWYAYLARGGKRSNIFKRIAQVPTILSPLFINLLYSALRRAEVWRHRQLIARVENIRDPEYHYNNVANYGLSVLAVVFLLQTLWVALV